VHGAEADHLRELKTRINREDAKARRRNEGKEVGMYGETMPAEVERVAAAIVDSAYKIHLKFGPGLLEPVVNFIPLPSC
jgi:hypothetical protein